MIKNNVDDTPVATTPYIPLPSTALPVPLPAAADPSPMNSDSEFLNWINSTPESELPSPEFGHTPLHSFEDDGFEDTPLNDLVTPQFHDLDIFAESSSSNNNNGTDKAGELNLDGLFTMDNTPDALMSYFDYNTFGDVTGTGVDSSSAMFGMTTESESLPLMGPPTNVSFADIWDDVPKKRRKVQVEVEDEDEQVRETEETTMRPADMHVSPSPSRPLTTMPPPELPTYVTSTHSGLSSTSPKPRSPPTSTLNIVNSTPSTVRNRTANKKYTGTRPGLTSEKLIPMDAPVQTRNYILPSSTSKKELPAAFADKVAQVQLANSKGKKRARSEVDDSPLLDATEENNVELGGVNLPHSSAASLQAAIEAKRLQNTYAARRSRARKLEYQKGLEEEVKVLREENEGLRNRVKHLENVIRGGGGRPPGPT